MEIRPQPGFQTQYLASPADICIGGGAAGAGKSYAAVVDPLRYHDVPGFSAIFFRRTAPELTGPGSIWEEASGIYPHFGGKLRETPYLDVRFPSGAYFKFSHLQHENDKLQHQSKQYAFVHFEEVTHFTEGQFWYLTSRARSKCGVRPYIRANCNPDPESFVAKLIEWWIDEDTGLPIPERAGVLRYFVRDGEEMIWADRRETLAAKFGEARPKSLTFIPGTLADNPILTQADPDYEAWLQSLPRVDRERLLGGNWHIRPAAGMYFKRHYYTIVESVADLPSPPVRGVRFWDKAATEVGPGSPDPDYTAGVKMVRLKDGGIAILDVIRDRGTPAKVWQWMQSAASRDGERFTLGCYQDPGQAGKVDREEVERRFQGRRLRFIRTARAGRGVSGGRGSNAAKVAQAGPLSAHAETRGIYLIRAPWNEALINEGEAFPDGGHDDVIDAAAGAFLCLTKRELAWA